MRGQDPFGRPLRLASGEQPYKCQNVAIAINAAVESLLPWASAVRRVREGGSTSAAGSDALSPSVKPGSKTMSGLRRTVDPFRPTYLTPPTRPRIARRSAPPDQAGTATAMNRAGAVGPTSNVARRLYCTDTEGSPMDDQLFDQEIDGYTIVEQTTREMLGAIARTADSGALDSPEACAGATALATQIMHETAKAAIPTREASFEAFIEASRLIETFAAQLAES